MITSLNARDIAANLVGDGMISASTMLTACLQYMSLDDVNDMLRSNDFLADEDEDEDGDE